MPASRLLLMSLARLTIVVAAIARNDNAHRLYGAEHLVFLDDCIDRGITDKEWFHLGLDAESLFTAGPLDEERLFAGRNGQVSKLLQTVLDRSKHAILFGERGTGKTRLVF